jgi:capsular exopolysaccharide synthesis family protein
MNLPNTGTASDQSNLNNQIQIDLLGVLNRRKWSLVFAAICGLAIGVCYMLFWPEKFQSTAQIMLMMNNSSAMASSNTNGPQNDLSEELLATHIQIIQSPRIIGKALAVKNTVENTVDPISETQSEAVSLQGSTLEKMVTTSTETAEDLESMPAHESNSEDALSKSSAKAEADSETPQGLVDSTKEQDFEKGVNSAVQNDLNSDLETSLAELPSIQAYVTEKVTPIDYVIDNLYVTSGGTGKAKKSHSLTIEFRHSDPEDAKKIVEAIVKQYEFFIKEKFQDVNSEAATLIVDARSELEGELSELAEKYQKFRSEVPLLATNTTGGNIYMQRYEELAAQLSSLQLAYDEAQGRFGTVQDALKNITGTTPAANLLKLSLIDNENAERLGILIGVERGEAATAAFMAKQPERTAGAEIEYQSLLQMKSKLVTMKEDFGNNHPEVKALANQIGATEKFLGEKAENLEVTDEDAQLTPDDVMIAYVKMLENDLVTMKKRQSDIENQMKIAEKQAKELVTFELQNETMVRARDHREALYDSVLERLREINMQGASSSMIHEVLDEPEVGEKVEPKPIIAALISILSAGLIGLGLVTVGELRDATIHDPSELETILDSKIIAHIPTFSKDKETWPDVRALEAKKPKIDPMLVVHHFPKSKLSEVFRATRTQLSFAVKGDHKSIAFTSANESDGKSTIVANIAVSIAQSGRSVILIDCDLRRPNTFRIFGIETDHQGLSDFIENGEPIESLTTPGPVENLTLLASGHISNNPAETLASREFVNLINDLKQKYDYVILDCPPLLPVSDPSIIASLVDSIVFVAKINKYYRPQTKRCLRIIEGVGKKFDGIIVNRADEAMGSYGYQTYGYEAASSKSYYRS